MNEKASNGNKKPHNSAKETTLASFENNALAQQYGGGHAGGWVGHLPTSWVPYVQLTRLSPPASVFIIYFPHFFGVMLAAIIQQSPISQVLRVSLTMLGGSFFFSNAAHAWNDLVDAPIDKAIARTSKRPIPRGAISPRAAFIFTVTQAITAASFLLFMPRGSAIYAAPNIVGTFYYPWAKRHTNFAQLVLGFCLSWGVMMGSCAMGLKPFTGAPFGAEDEWKQTFWFEPSIASLFLANIIWTAIHDSIYAHQDVKDDIKAGLKSMAVLFREYTKPFLWLSLVCMIALLYTCGNLLDMGIPFYLIAGGGSILSAGSMIANVELKDSASCWWWFRYGFWLVGGAITGGLLSEYVSLTRPSF